MTEKPIGFIGLGTMGRHMAANIQKSGLPMIVCDINKSAAEALLSNSAVWADSPRDVAAQCDIIFMSLPGPPQVEAVALGEDGLLSALQKGAVVCDLSTNSRAVVQKVDAAFQEKGAHLLDCPVSGGPSGAESGKLAIWVGGDRQAFERCKPVLDRFSDQPRYVGGIGQATVAKLVHNMTQYAMTVVLAEVMTMGVKAGVDPLDLYTAIRQGAVGRRRTFDTLLPQILTGKFEPPAFQLKLAHKDVKLATELAREVGVPMRMCEMAFADMQEAMNRGFENRDSRSCVIPQQDRAGVSLATDADALRKALADDKTEVVVHAIP